MGKKKDKQDKQEQIQRIIAERNYSTLDLLTGRAMIEILNEIDPDNTWSLADDEDYVLNDEGKENYDYDDEEDDEF